MLFGSNGSVRIHFEQFEIVSRRTSARKVRTMYITSALISSVKLRTVFCLALFALAFGPQNGFSKGKDVVHKDCYPENRFVKTNSSAETGETWASGGAQAEVASIEADFHGDTRDLGSAFVSFKFNAKIEGANTVTEPGKTEGDLTVVLWWETPELTGGVQATQFDSGCVAELETQHQSSPNIGEVETEMEGSVENFPFYNHTEKAAVASVVVTADSDHPGRVEADLVIELGYTCFENIYADGDGDIETEKIAIKDLDPDLFHINNNGSHGVWNFPFSFNPNNCTGVDN
jgi:hypothetical protein